MTVSVHHGKRNTDMDCAGEGVAQIFGNWRLFFAGLVMEALSDGGVLGGESQIIGLIVSMLLHCCCYYYIHMYIIISS